MIYNFDEIIDRTHNNAAKYDERIKKFGTQDVIPLWIADMDFRVAKPIEDALADKAHQGILAMFPGPGNIGMPLPDGRREGTAGKWTNRF